MRRLLPVCLGALLLIGASAGFVVVPEHHGTPDCSGYGSGPCPLYGGWPQTTYDLARIGTWALLIVGLLLVAVGLIAYARRDTPARAA